MIIEKPVPERYKNRLAAASDADDADGDLARRARAVRTARSHLGESTSRAVLNTSFQGRTRIDPYPPAVESTLQSRKIH